MNTQAVQDQMLGAPAELARSASQAHPEEAKATSAQNSTYGNDDLRTLVLQLFKRIEQLELDLKLLRQEKQDACTQITSKENTNREPRANTFAPFAANYHFDKQSTPRFGLSQSRWAHAPEVKHGPKPRARQPVRSEPDLVYPTIKFITGKQFLEEQEELPSNSTDDAKNPELNVAEENVAEQTAAKEKPIWQTDVGRQTLDEVFAEDEDEYESDGFDVEGETILSSDGHRLSDAADTTTQVEKKEAKEKNAWDEIEDPELRAGMLALQEQHLKRPPPKIQDTGFDLEAFIKKGEEKARTPPTAPRAMRESRFFSSSPPVYGGSFNNEMDVQDNASPSVKTDMWNSLEERESQMANRSDFSFRFPESFRHGIRFHPKTAKENHMKAILMTNLPLDTELKTVLQKVRGGPIAKASLLNTKKILGGSMTALVIFCYAFDAADYCEYVLTNPINFGPDGRQAEVELIHTPTYPVPLSRINSRSPLIQTRVLQVKDLPAQHTRDSLVMDIADGNAWRGGSIMEMYYDESSVLNIEFSSIQMAGSAFGMLLRYHKFRGSQVFFAEDPCSRPLCTLQDPLPIRPAFTPYSHPPVPDYPAAFSRHGSISQETISDESISINGDTVTSSEAKEDSTPHVSPKTTTSTASRPITISVNTMTVSSSTAFSSATSQPAKVEMKSEETCRPEFRSDGFREAPRGLMASRYAQPEVKRGGPNGHKYDKSSKNPDEIEVSLSENEA